MKETYCLLNGNIIKKLIWLNDDFFNKNRYFLGFKKYIPNFETNGIYEETVKNKNISLVCHPPDKAIKFDSVYSYAFDIMRQFPGDSRLTEYIYANNPLTELDLNFMSFDSCKAIRERYKKVKQLLMNFIIEKMNGKGKNETIKIISLGSGAGYDVMEVIEDLIRQDPSCKIKATLLDSDKNAIKKGLKRADELSLSDKIIFVSEGIKAFEYKNKYDIALLVGVLCPFTELTCVNTLSVLHPHLKSNGIMIASNISKKVCETEEGQFARFMMEYICNWFLAYKDKNELRNIFEKSGYKDITIEAEPVGYHLLGIGRRLDN